MCGRGSKMGGSVRRKIVAVRAGKIGGGMRERTYREGGCPLSGVYKGGELMCAVVGWWMWGGAKNLFVIDKMLNSVYAIYGFLASYMGKTIWDSKLFHHAQLLAQCCSKVRSYCA